MEREFSQKPRIPYYDVVQLLSLMNSKGVDRKVFQDIVDWMIRRNRMSGRYINNPEELLMDIKDVATQFREEILEVVNEIMLTDYNSLESKVQEKVVEDKNLTFEQLCEYVSVTRPTIYKWKKKGLKSYKVEGKVLFKLSEVQEFLKSHQNK